MQKCCLILLTMAACLHVHGQTKNETIFRVGANIAFGLSHIADNEVGIGGIAGVEKSFNHFISGEIELSYTYFTGDKMLYAEGRNKAWALPLLTGIKIFPKRWLYGSLRAGAIGFLLNHDRSTNIRPAYGIAAGANLPEKLNRLNVQLGYTGFRYSGNNRGYATLAAAIIIN